MTVSKMDEMRVFRNVFKRERERDWMKQRITKVILWLEEFNLHASNHEWFMYNVNIVFICISSDQNQKDLQKKKIYFSLWMYIRDDSCVCEKKTLFSSTFHPKWTFKMTDEPISFDK